MTPYKSPIKHTDGRQYFFYNYSAGAFQIYMANKRTDERENPVIVVDEYGNTVASGTLRDFRRLMG